MSSGTPLKIKKDIKEDVSSQLKGQAATEMASVEITKCIKFQKFRYAGEERPGKKYQDKDFVILKLTNLKDQVVRVVIMCIDADNPELMHPNGLIGAHCTNGIYDKEYAVTKRVFEIVIPYIRIERTKTKKTSLEQIKQIMRTRVSSLPVPYKERSRSQYSNWEKSPMKFKTAKVRLAVFVTLDDDRGNLNGTLHVASNVISNCSEKTMLNIHKLSRYAVSARTGGNIDVFTTENGPDIEPDNYFLQVSYESDTHQISWKSEEYWPEEMDILYKRIISYKVPPFEPNPDLAYPVTATLHIECPASNLHCTQTFEYVPQADTQIISKTSYSQDDTENCEKKEPGMFFDTNGSINEITTKGNDETMHMFQSIYLQE
ncbi:unnamed protein product [Candidula unifasciata]|uniref:RHD domain-containing protein n=1 Tax=Candidula unifasciata TaxID=100452 RepID=A0A8S3YN92_9EUPU|nr:unnamed protein product [Candidula unifasciata]